MKLCKCGCGQKLRQKSEFKYIKNHMPHGEKNHRWKASLHTPGTKLCKCGCGKTVKLEKNTYINGHNDNKFRGKHHTIEARKKIHEKQLGKHMTASAKEKCRKASAETREKFRKIHLGCKLSLDTIKKIRTKRLIEWTDPVQREKRLKALFKVSCRSSAHPNREEKFLDILIQQSCSNEYSYVGDGSVLVGYKSPDFININGRKKLIEFYGDYWHQSETDSGRGRKQHFKKFGFDTLIIWEHELVEPDRVIEKVKDFTYD